MNEPIIILVSAAALMFIVIGGLSMLAHFYTLNGIKSKTVGDGQHGVARFLTAKEIKKTYNQVPYDTQLAKERNKHVYELELRSKVVESKNDFLAKMSHDIRTPLNAIIGMNFIATTQVEETAPVMESEV